MPRRFHHVHEVGDLAVPYSLNPRPDRGKWSVDFIGLAGERKRILTTYDVLSKMPPADAHHEAKRLITETFLPPAALAALQRKPWDELLAEVERTSPHTRPETLRGLRAAIKALKETLPEITSPCDVTDLVVKRFCRLWLAAPSKQGGGKRSPVSLSYYVRSLSSLSNHLIELGHIEKNLWYGVKVPKAEKKLKPAPTEEEVSDFFAHVHKEYPDWKALHALLELKALSACRTADVCQIRSEELLGNQLLRGKQIIFDAAADKTKRSRAMPLPKDLAKTLAEVAGPEWLWEKMFSEIRLYRKATNGYPPSFAWQTIRNVVNNIFREFNDARPGKPRLTPHGFRRRAITLVVKSAGSVDAAAMAIGVHPQTARNHYLDAQKAFDADAILRRAMKSLRPKMKPPTKSKGVGKSTSGEVCSNSTECVRPERGVSRGRTASAIPSGESPQATGIKPPIRHQLSSTTPKNA